MPAVFELDHLTRQRDLGIYKWNIHDDEILLVKNTHGRAEHVAVAAHRHAADNRDLLADGEIFAPHAPAGHRVRTAKGLDSPPLLIAVLVAHEDVETCMRVPPQNAN